MLRDSVHSVRRGCSATSRDIQPCVVEHRKHCAVYGVVDSRTMLVEHPALSVSADLQHQSVEIRCAVDDLLFNGLV